MDTATRQHEAKPKELDHQRAALERRSQEEEQRWQKQKDKLEAASGRARD
jgi:colicin import membrane protein